MAFTGAPPTWLTGESPQAADVNRWEIGGAYVPLRAFQTGGLSDDQMLTAFMSYAGAQTHTGIACLLDESRAYTFSQVRNPYNGFALVSPFPGNGDQDRSGHPNPFTVTVNCAGGWLNCNGKLVYDVVLSGLSFNCGSSTYLVENSGSPWLWRFNDIGFQNGIGVFGSSTRAVGQDAISFTGTWNINAVRDCAFNMGGSDSSFSPTLLLLDAPNTGYLPVTGYLARFNSLTFCRVANWLVTCDQHSGLLVSGSNNSGVFMSSCTWQGRNATTPCFGALIRINGGMLSMNQCHLDYAMTSPATSGHGDLGYVHVASGGFLQASCCISNFASGQDGTQPVVYVEEGGTAVISNWVGFLGNGGSYVKPVVHQAVAGSIIADSSVTVITG